MLAVLARTVEGLLTWCAMIGLRHRRQMVGVAKAPICPNRLVEIAQNRVSQKLADASRSRSSLMNNGHIHPCGW